MRQQHRVGKGVVDGQDGHGGENALEDGTEDVADVAGEPDDDEEDGEAIGGGAAEVFEDLGGEDDDPAGDGDGSWFFVRMFGSKGRVGLIA